MDFKDIKFREEDGIGHSTGGCRILLKFVTAPDLCQAD